MWGRVLDFRSCTITRQCGRVLVRGVSLAATLALVLMSMLGAGLMLAPLSVAAPPPDFQKSLVVGEGLNGPSGFEIAPDGRIFVLERSGKIKIVKNGQLLPTPFADLPSEATGDRGLIGIAFDPDFGVSNHYVYFYYTGHDLLNHLVRFSAAGDVGTDGPYELFRTASPSQLLHVGGSIAFGPDGKLYFAVGDNGTGEKSQQLDNPHGKMLRINKDGTIPSDNPFVGQSGKLGAIWAYGFRNPWRFQFDSANGKLYGADVGDFTWEELNRIEKGRNYGWPVHEGECLSNCTGFTDPIHAYHHDGSSASVTGGPVYRGTMFPSEYRGSLFFGDYADGWIKRAVLNADGDVTSVHDFDNQAGSVVDMKVAPDGSMYYITYYPGALYRVSYNTTSHAPIATATADQAKGLQPLTVQFSSAGSEDPDGDPLTFEWDLGDGTTSTEPNPAKTYTEKGVYTVRLRVSDGQETSLAQPIVIQVGIPPTLTVAAPTEGALYRAGDTITYNAFASDAAGFDLDDGAIKTEIRLHHGSHYHPFAGPLTGRAGSFTVPTTGEASADTSYETKVTATDTNGLSTTKTVEIRPRTSQLTLDTSPPGLGLTLDGVPVSTPHTMTGVEGFKRDLVAPNTAVAADGTPLHFAGWSDGKSIRHTITTPEEDASYTATYKPSAPFTGTYYDNQTLAGTPVLTRQDPEIDFVWDSGSPDPAVPADRFSVRWSKTQYFGAGRYRFTTVADDGVRLYLDGKRVIDRFDGPANTEFSHVADLGTGEHTIEMEYVENTGGALATLKWDSTLEQPVDSYRAHYWNSPPGVNEIPDSAPDLVRDEDVIDHDWGSGSPASHISVDRFSARWTRTLSLAPGEYEFTVTADDGVRLFLDGVPVIDKWEDQAPTTYSARLPLDGGPHSLVMEYYENGGAAVAKMNYLQVGDLPQPSVYHGEYWNTAEGDSSPVIPTRAPDFERDDPEIAFDWASGSPAPAINPDYFVVRWTRTEVLSAGVYRFSGASDDGIRVFVDNEPIVDMWQLQNAPYSADKVLSGGSHVIRVEYFEARSGARASFGYQRVGDIVPVGDVYSAEYFANTELAGAPALTRTDTEVDFDWGNGSPGGGIPADNFSARWTKSTVLAAGAYKFTVTGDDGVRLFVDGVLILDEWIFQAPTTYTVPRQLGEGTHVISLEYFEATGGAVARLAYELTDETPPPPPPPPPPANAFRAEYFANPTLSGVPVLVRDDAAIDFDWGNGSPAAGVPTNKFSARWTRTNTYEAGRYRLRVTGDDGIRVLVDGALVIDGWKDQRPTDYVTEVPLTAGEHTVVVEYYERNGGAAARFSEESVPPVGIP